MIFEQIKTGGDRNFAYLVADEVSKEAAVIDPSFRPDRLLARAAELGLTIRYVINTHGHGDHSNGNGRMLAGTQATLVGHSVPSPGLAVNDGDELPLGEVTLKIIHTPGHTPDSICILAGDKLMTGDTLFVGKVGGTGFGDDARQEFRSLREKLLTLPDHIEVYPGHNVGVSPSSTIGAERADNPFLLRDTFESFLDLKMNWAEYKLEHKIQ
ncbi:MAG: MBL fold metallo-hydrolase [bacterium]|nr:MBL fold metallo-hydrolase [bacterium]